MDLQKLIDEIEDRADSDDPLDQLEEAARQHDQLTDAADRVLDHFVKAARESGCSWAQIGGVLGVTKQAAQQRHSGDQGVLGWLRSWAGKRGLFTRFTARARDVAVGAQQAARDLGHNYVGTEHILLALYTDSGSIAAKALASWEISRDEVVAEVEQRIGRGGVVPSGHIPYTPRAKKILELSLREALSLGHNYIGTEHILLGVVRVDDGIGGQILGDRGVTSDQARQTIVSLLTGDMARGAGGDDPSS
ncbi:MAG: Clp protease N-terminal domain-containing protein [Acidimicrobiales bacterium]